MGHFTPLNLDKYTSTPIKKKSAQIINTVVIFSVFAFVLSTGFYVQTTLFQSSSKAQIQTKQNVPVTLVAFPAGYKDEKIPSSLYQENLDLSIDPKNKDKKDYVRGYLIRYYAYRDSLAENEIAYDSSLSPDTFASLVEAVNSLEGSIKVNLISSIDFAYVKVPFGDSKVKAKKIAEKYQTLFSKSLDPQSVIDSSNADEELMLLNNKEENQYLQNYTASQHLFAYDHNFPYFLFALDENKTSDIYTLRNENNQSVAYLVVLPTLINIKKYLLLDQIIQEKMQHFSYTDNR